MRGEKGSSRWLVLSAVVFRQAEDVETVRPLRRYLPTIWLNLSASKHSMREASAGSVSCCCLQT